MNMNWDNYWMRLCNEIASNSKCLSRKIGAVVVKDNRFIVSTGYNGPPAGCMHCGDIKYRRILLSIYRKDLGIPHVDGIDDISVDMASICPRKLLGFDSGQGLQYCRAAHAERNAVDIAARLGRSLEGMTMYMNCCIPCLECAKTLINSGVREIAVTSLEPYEKSGLTGEMLLVEAKVKIRLVELR